MLPANLKAEHFAKYPPQAEKVAVSYLAVLQQLPLSFLPSLLRELIDYDYKFPAERSRMDKELAKLRTLTPGQTAEWFQSFSQVRLLPSHERFDWVDQPSQFTEQLSAYLWSTHQMDAFRNAATAYGGRILSAMAPEALPTRRVGIAVVGQGVTSYEGPLFRKLRDHGTYFSRIDTNQGLDHLLAAAAARAQEHPVPYSHWYVDGGAPADHHPLLTCVSYEKLGPARDVLLRDIDHEVAKPGMGPEELRSYLMRLSPSELGLGGDALLDRFQVKILTEGSGTQIFSTTFAQWTAREVLRRAEPLTLLVRFAPRQRQRPMNELLSSNPGHLGVDPVGSLIDADMGAYYQWINQQRLPESQQSAFVVWFEGHGQALAIGPSLARGAESKSPLDLGALFSLAVA